MSGFSVPTLFKASEVFGASGFTKDDLVLGWTKPEGDSSEGYISLGLRITSSERTR